MTLPFAVTFAIEACPRIPPRGLDAHARHAAGGPQRGAGAVVLPMVREQRGAGAVVLQMVREGLKSFFLMKSVQKHVK